MAGAASDRVPEIQQIVECAVCRKVSRFVVVSSTTAPAVSDTPSIERRRAGSDTLIRFQCVAPHVGEIIGDARHVTVHADAWAVCWSGLLDGHIWEEIEPTAVGNFYGRRRATDRG